MAEATLQSAAANVFVNLQNWWRGGGSFLAQQLTLFVNTAKASFPDAAPNNHPITNWLAIIAAFATTIPVVGSSFGDAAATQPYFSEASSYVYRICWMADYLNSIGLITNGQAAALLAAYNAALL